MDTKVIEVRKVIPIIQTLSTISNSSFTQNIYIDFEPDEVIIKSYSYSYDKTEIGISNIYSDLVNDIICSFFDSSSGYLNTHFLLQRKIGGTYTFQLRNSAGLPTTRQGDFSIFLEFVKYKEVKGQKIY